MEVCSARSICNVAVPAESKLSPAIILGGNYYSRFQVFHKREYRTERKTLSLMSEYLHIPPMC